jgi:hypothetical protein
VFGSDSSGKRKAEQRADANVLGLQVEALFKKCRGGRHDSRLRGLRLRVAIRPFFVFRVWAVSLIYHANWMPEWISIFLQFANVEMQCRNRETFCASDCPAIT